MNLRSLLILLVVFSLAACRPQPSAPGRLAAAAAAPDAGLVFYNWEADLPTSVLAAFTAETGISVRYLGYESQEQALANLRAGGEYDVVVLDNPRIPTAAAEGLLAPISPAGVPNFKNISANFRNLVYDPSNRYSIPYNWGVVGLLSRSGRPGGSARSWDDIWTHPEAGRLALRRGEPREGLGIALKSLGCSINSESPAELQAALARLLSIRERIVFLEDGAAGPVELLAQGGAGFATAYATDALQARQTGSDIAFSLPSEGAFLWGDSFTIPAASRHRAEAESLINFFLRPEISAQIANYNHYATPNEAAYPWIEPENLNDWIIFPRQEDLLLAEAELPLSPAGRRLHEQAWERFLQAMSEPDVSP